jgi:hypothetical protein
VFIRRSVHGWQPLLDLAEEVCDGHLQTLRHQDEDAERRKAPAALHFRDESLRERLSELRLRQAELAAARSDAGAEVP